MQHLWANNMRRGEDRDWGEYDAPIGVSRQSLGVGWVQPSCRPVTPACGIGA